MLERVISGGQTGADQAGWRAAKSAGIPTGGAMPKGFLMEDGPRPELAALYGAHELDSEEYPARTEANVKASDGTLWFGSPHTPGGRCTMDCCFRAGKALLIVPLEGATVRPSEAARWIAANQIRVLNVAGNRESAAPGIGARVEAFLVRVFALTQRLGETAG
jgi:hypothetical protein